MRRDEKVSGRRKDGVVELLVRVDGRIENECSSERSAVKTRQKRENLKTSALIVLLGVLYCLYRRCV